MNLMIKRTREVHSGSLEIGRILALRQEVIEMMSQIRGTKKIQILSYIVQYLLQLFFIINAFVFNVLLYAIKMAVLTFRHRKYCMYNKIRLK